MPDIANAAGVLTSHLHNPYGRHWGVEEKVAACLNAKRDIGITYERGSRLSLTVLADADKASKLTGRRSVFGVAVRLGGAVVVAVSRTQHGVTLPTMKAEYVAMAERVKEQLLLRLVRSFIQPGVAFSFELFEDNEGGIAMAKTPPRFAKSKYIECHFVRDLSKAKTITVTHVKSGWYRSDVLTKAPTISLFQRGSRICGTASDCVCVPGTRVHIFCARRLVS